MPKRIIYTACLSLTAITLAACDSSTSENVNTNEIKAEITITYKGGDTARIDTELYKYRNVLLNPRTYIDLICPDMLVANSTTQPGSTVLRKFQDSLGKYYYKRDIYAGGGDIVTVSPVTI